MPLCSVVYKTLPKKAELSPQISMLLHLITNPHITEADLMIYINVNLEAKGKRGAKQEKKEGILSISFNSKHCS